MLLGVRYLEGQQPYEPVWQAMKDFTDHRTDQTQDEVWILEHAPVFTQGQAGKSEHVLLPGDIPVVQSDRGGQVTYHGPGQITAYIMADIKRLSIGPRALVDTIESSIVNTLKEFGVESYPKPDAPGVYVGASKIASLGLRIRKGYSFHGLALNVDMDLEPFSRINPCGYAGMAMTQLAQHVAKPDIKTVSQKLVDQITRCLPYEGIQELGSELP